MSVTPKKVVRFIVDSNMLQANGPREFLAKSPSNFAVITDYAAMEAYKGNTLVSIFESMKILSEFPRQVIVLKSTGEVCGLRARAAGLQRRMIDEKSTKEFPMYCRRLEAARQGDAALQRQLLEMGSAADKQLDRILADINIIPPGIQELRKYFDVEELKIIRNESDFSPSLIEKFGELMIEFTKMSMQLHPRSPKFQTGPELLNQYLFRISVCTLVWALDWIARGGAENVRPERMRNDIVDIAFATFATYFEGLLSNDKKVVRMYTRTSYILTAMGAIPAR